MLLHVHLGRFDISLTTKTNCQFSVLVKKFTKSSAEAQNLENSADNKIYSIFTFVTRKIGLSVNRLQKVTINRHDQENT